MEARAKQNAAASAASSSTNDKSKPEPETHRKPEGAAAAERHHVTDAVLRANNNAAHARNANDCSAGHRADTGSAKMAVVGTGDLYARRPTSVIAFSVPPPGKMADDQRAYVNDRKTSLAPFGVLSLS